ncbi:MAG: SGNH/GDSL hydrolase family protein, partial [Clostridia bacterium]|nr:SGNH/GDSL hydrolase family protein [Clostridia bacterium]
EYLKNAMLELTGYELYIVDEAEGAHFYIDSANADDGLCHVDIDGERISLSGVGVNGAYTAAKAFISELGRTADVTLESFSAPMFKLPNTAAKLREGSLKVGTMGDSVPHAPGFKSLAVIIPEAIGEAYPDATVEYSNPSLGGRNTYWGVYNIEEMLLDEGYTDLVFLTLGANDPPYGAQYNEIVLNYQSTIEKIMRANPYAEIIILNYGRKTQHASMANGNIEYYMKAKLDVAEHYGIPFIDICYDVHQRCLEAESYDEEWKAIFKDDVHPHQDGQDYYANFYLRSILPAIEAAGNAELAEKEMPERIFENSKINTKTYSANLDKSSEAESELNARAGEGDEAGWQRDGWTYTKGSVMYIDFEGIGLELDLKTEGTAKPAFTVEIFNEDGKSMMRKNFIDFDSYYAFVTADLVAGRYTAKIKAVTVKQGAGLGILSYCIIEDPNK